MRSSRYLARASMALLVSLVVAVCCSMATAAQDGKLRIIVFGAHPDDCEIKAGGTAALWAAQGHHVKFVSVTNGDIGHAEMAGGALAQRRTAEVKEAAKILGIESEVLDIHDGELLPTLENRKRFVKLIREWKADIVMGHRPNDYHPDHRYVGVLMQDAAFMVTVRFFCPDVPQLAKNPVFLYLSDNFRKPNPFAPDVVVATDAVPCQEAGRALDASIANRIPLGDRQLRGSGPGPPGSAGPRRTPQAGQRAVRPAGPGRCTETPRQADRALRRREGQGH